MREAAAGIELIDRLSDVSGRIIAWLTLLMVLVTLVVVVLRYVFGLGFIWLQESVSWMHAVVFMLGAAYTLQRDEHVRVDVFYRAMPPARKAIVDGLGVLLFLWPVCAFLFLSSFDFVERSWALREASREAGGLPFPLIPLLKSVLLLMPVMLALQGLSMLVAAARTLKAR